MENAVKSAIGAFLTRLPLIASLALGGCFNFEVAKTPEFTQKRLLGNDEMPIAHCITSNYGWYLFNSVPLICGNADPDAWWPWAMFRDDVTLDKLQGRLVSASQRMKTNLVDLEVSYTDTCMISIPSVKINTTLGLLWYKEIQLSAAFVDPSTPAKGVREMRQRELQKSMTELLDRLEAE